MPSEIQIRNAIDSDIEFIIETIVLAEKGNGNVISYCNLFNISETEFRIVLGKILKEGICNFEFSLENYKIAESDGTSLGAYGAWLEGKDGISSGILKISAFKTFLGKENIVFYKSVAPVADEISIRRQPGTIQFESIYILEEYRGKNIGMMLVQALLNDLIEKHPGVKAAQVQVMKQNAVSLQAHINYGFKIVAEKTALNPQILKFYSGDTRVLMEKKLR
jgi:ribosomal protein S18 acetylase RimI-like enzyme